MNLRTTSAACIIAMTSISTVFAASNEPNSNDVALASIVLGLNAESLACLNVHGSEVNTVFDRLETEYDQFDQFLIFQQQLADAIQLQAVYEAMLRLDPNDQEAQAELHNAMTSANAAALSALQSRSLLITNVLEGLADTSMIDEVLFAEGRIAKLPAAYRLAVSTETQADRLCWAIETDTRAQDQGGSTPTEAQSELNTAHAQSTVQLGLARVIAHSQSNQNAIDLWMLSN